ncbi:hypothetical protein M422DRAFT_53881 [Sphaerobolus stellatus SS14]|uniref:Uncharacterized protein n=1 Tax=Sphaerobolus stellatus (strain SS14) TaxID=990650 RepID=A0A0C9UYB7_SPHS4|nr:hypothetical protein M422DRAFT_53881 [Sphaerobolus stellatus SS14]
MPHYQPLLQAEESKSGSSLSLGRGPEGARRSFLAPDTFVSGKLFTVLAILVAVNLILLSANLYYSLRMAEILSRYEETNLSSLPRPDPYVGLQYSQANCEYNSPLFNEERLIWT